MSDFRQSLSMMLVRGVHPGAYRPGVAATTAASCPPIATGPDVDAPPPQGPAVTINGPTATAPSIRTITFFLVVLIGSRLSRDITPGQKMLSPSAEARTGFYMFVNLSSTMGPGR
jgi:hypothetical protein